MFLALSGDGFTIGIEVSVFGNISLYDFLTMDERDKERKSRNT